MLPFLLAAVAGPICAGVPLPAAVQRYATLTQAQDVPALARLFGRDGVLVGPGGAPLTGAGEVARFLGGFRGYRVVEERMTVETVGPAADSWQVSGGFAQRGATPDGAPYATHGVYTMRWRCTAVGWRVLRVATESAP
ncbi:nuclear transport factor 2 family protein [Sphingomonas sp.]|uniref:nuclear transport factor 2 family protein n=1 Tax=Sphingomonas sp. TaxID=28214 RepID=UPI003CC6A76F